MEDVYVVVSSLLTTKPTTTTTPLKSDHSNALLVSHAWQSYPSTWRARSTSFKTKKLQRGVGWEQPRCTASSKLVPSATGKHTEFRSTDTRTCVLDVIRSLCDPGGLVYFHITSACAASPTVQGAADT